MLLKKSLSLLLSLSLVYTLSAQHASFFTLASAEQALATRNAAMAPVPQKFDAYQLHLNDLKALLATAPWESTAAAARQACVAEIPIAGGAAEPFSIWQVAMLDAELAAAYPEIRTYAGVSLRDARRTIRFSVTPRGFRAIVMNPDLSAAMIKPVNPAEPEGTYMVYHYADAAENPLKGLRTGIAEDGSVWFGEPQDRYVPPAEERGEEIEPVRLKVFRYCAAATGEFTQDHGGTKPLSLAAVTEYTNVISAIFERDIAIRLQLTAATQYVIFLDPANDPYNLGPTVQDYMAQNPEVLNTYTNFNSHDLGHVYTRYLGGSAIGVAGGLGVACGASKAAGCSAGLGLGDYGDGFISVVGQEVGHQLGGGHTWNRCNGGGGRNGGTAFEPGSGSTIMSYAGACQSDNIQDYSDLYYHAGSIQEIRYYSTVAASCGSFQEKPNHLPEVSLSYPENFNIPISTPFELNGTASDPDGDPLSYSWEGVIYGDETPLGQPLGSTATFRSWPAVDVTNRYFPRLSTILANSFNPAEQLPTYTRDLKFRFTARDNKPDGGGVAWADVEFRAVESAGPFLVSFPNTGSDVMRVGELTQVLWDVANTNGTLVNCQHVNIRLSIDGGQTYPFMLAANTENDGSHYVLTPNEITNNARLRVEAADNVFFDISNANFKIEAPVAPSLTLGLSSDGSTICLPDNFSTTIQTAGVLGYNTPITLSLIGNPPPGATATFSTTTLNPGESATLDVDLSNVAVEGSFSFTIQAVSGTETMLRPVSLFLRRNDFTGFALQTPPNGATNQSLVQTLRWSKGLDADNYDVQFSDSPAFTNILAASNATSLDSLKINFLLEKGKAYYWRIRPRNECGVHAWSVPFFFSTFPEACINFTANDLPKNISANGTPTVESQITVVQGGAISDLVISEIDGFHEYFRDLEASIISPQGTEILLWKDRCGSYNGSFTFGFSDLAPAFLTCPPNSGQTFKPANPLAPLLGQNSTGAWKLRIKDKAISSGGVLENFKLQFCQSVTPQPPFVVNNLVMSLSSGSDRIITPDFLLVEDPNNTHAQLVYTMVTKPEHGWVDKAGFGALAPGDQFTQADIDAGWIHYYDFGGHNDPDGFYFVVTDGEGGFLGTPKFIVQPLVSALEPGSEKLDFSLFPNPSHSATWVAFSQVLSSDARISLFNTAGQLVSVEELPTGQTKVQIQLGQLPKGIYVVRVETKQGVGVRKLVVE
ncbi:MAG: cadherin-like domain-containing protein [Saprospiraceae bacterium]|nr:cadherin-like domain-containing protein [Saprospiraceae bacterium]